MSNSQETKSRRISAPDRCARGPLPDYPKRTLQRGFAWLMFFGWMALAISRSAWAQQPKELNARFVAAELDATKDAVTAEVTAILKTNSLKTSYTTVWRNFEDAAIDALWEILPKHVAGLTGEQLDRGKTGREKNRPSDLAILRGPNAIEISIKAARKSANPENDLGTFHDRPARKKLFADSFTLWVRYDDSGKEIKCDRVFFDRSWRFVGKSSLVDGVKYRKKDGNLRPKPWLMFDAGEAFWKTEKAFEEAVSRAETFRANELVKEHLQSLTEQDQRVLYERLGEKFGKPPPDRP